MKIKLFCSLLLVVLGLSVFPKVVSAAEVVLPLTDDTFIDQNEPNATFGGSSTLFVTAKPDQNRIILLKFGLSEIPKDSNIRSASLTMRADTCGGLDETPRMLLSYSNDDWSESTAKWIGRPRIGLDIDLIDATPRTKTFNMTTAVSKWVKGTTTNKGVILTIQGGPYECEFRSIERDPDDIQLIVQYEPPAKSLVLPNANFKLPLITLHDVSSGSAQATPAASPSISPSSTPEPAPTSTPEADTSSEKDQNLVITPQQMIIGLVALVIILLVALAGVVISKMRSKPVTTPATPEIETKTTETHAPESEMAKSDEVKTEA